PDALRPTGDRHNSAVQCPRLLTHRAAPSAEPATVGIRPTTRGPACTTAPPPANGRNSAITAESGSQAEFAGDQHALHLAGSLALLDDLGVAVEAAHRRVGHET